MKNLSETFSRVYDLRTKFFSIFEIKDVTIFSYELKNLIGEQKESEIKECIKSGETLSNWEEEIKRQGSCPIFFTSVWPKKPGWSCS